MQPKPNSAMDPVKRIAQLLTVFLVLSIMPIAGYAEESYGQTQAQEGVCDLLNDEGVTKGLYSLCLAFCGEQDFASNELPFMEKNRETIQNGRPEEQILEKYNKIKKAEDPELPCAVPAEGECPCFSEDEFRAMSDGFRDVEPYDEITTMWEANGDVEGEWFRAYGGEEGENGDGAWTWIESSIGEGNWCFYEWVQEGYPMVKETVLELTDEEFMACYRIIEAECSAQ
jgi:hypothetical protein